MVTMGAITPPELITNRKGKCVFLRHLDGEIWTGMVRGLDRIGQVWQARGAWGRRRRCR